MASKKASASSPVSSWIARASGGEVRGPVAMMTESQSCGGSPAISSRRISISGWLARAWVTAVAKPSRSTARAPHQRAQPPHLLVQQPDRVVLAVVGAERVGADELGEAFGLVRLGHAHRPHLVEHDGNAPACDLPGGFRSGEPPADDVHGLHAPDMSRPRDGGKRPDTKTPAQAAGVLGCGRRKISDGRRARRWP